MYVSNTSTTNTIQQNGHRTFFFSIIHRLASLQSFPTNEGQQWIAFRPDHLHFLYCIWSSLHSNPLIYMGILLTLTRRWTYDSSTDYFAPPSSLSLQYQPCQTDSVSSAAADPHRHPSIIIYPVLALDLGLRLPMTRRHVFSYKP